MNTELSSTLNQDVESPSRIDRTSEDTFYVQPNNIETREGYESSILLSRYKFCPEWTFTCDNYLFFFIHKR